MTSGCAQRRYWTRYFATEDSTSGFPARAEPGTVNDPVSKKTHRVDVAAFGLDDANRETLLAVGEAKWQETMGMGHLERLRHIRSLLTVQGRRGAATARLLCFSGAGFTAELADEVTRSRHKRFLEAYSGARSVTSSLPGCPAGPRTAQVMPACGQDFEDSGCLGTPGCTQTSTMTGSPRAAGRYARIVRKRRRRIPHGP